MKNFRLLLLLTLLIAPVAFAQNKVTVKGVVKSAETGEPLFGAYILVGGGGASTDENGAYSVTAAPGETLSYSVHRMRSLRIHCPFRTSDRRP